MFQGSLLYSNVVGSLIRLHWPLYNLLLKGFIRGPDPRTFILLRQELNIFRICTEVDRVDIS